MEVADLIVVNKADKAGADEVVRDVEAAFDLDDPRPDWRPPVLRTVATSGEGVSEVWQALGRHRAHLEEAGRLERRRAHRLAGEVRRLVEEDAARTAGERCHGPSFERIARQVTARELDPVSAAEALAAAYSGSTPSVRPHVEQ
jgi:LAO/AO transport system kinase